MLNRSMMLWLCLSIATGLVQAQDAPADLTDLRERAESGDARAQAELSWALLQTADSAEKMLQVVRLAEASAEAGDTEGLNVLGVLYQVGRGVPQDREKALGLFREAAEKGDPKGWFNIGLTWSEGYGGPADLNKALSFYQKAAGQDFAPAMTLLGAYHQNGIGGLEADLAEAVRWYRRALEQEEQPGALLQLGALTVDGTGVEKNVEEGLRMIRRAAELGLPNAAYTLGAVYQAGKIVDQDLPAARKWYAMAADGQHALAAFQLAEMMRKGEGGEADPEGGVKHYQFAAQQGQVDSMYWLYKAYDEGSGVEPNPETARYWLTQAAQRGYLLARLELGSRMQVEERRQSVPAEKVQRIRDAAESGAGGAQMILADLYRYGRGVRRDLEEAARWYLAAAEQGVVEAMTGFAEVRLKDEDAAEEDQQAGLQWLRRAAEQGSASAGYQLGMRLMTGTALDKNEREASRWLRSAAEQGHRPAVVGYAFALYSGRGARSDRKAAARWLQLIDPDSGFPAFDSLAGDYKRGDGVPRDRVYAHFLYGLSGRLEQDEDAAKEQSELAADLSEKELARSARLDEAFEAAGSADDPRVACTHRLAEAERLQDDDAFGEALEHAQAAVPLCRKAYGRDHYRVATALLQQASVEEDLENAETAAALFNNALEQLSDASMVPAEVMLGALNQLAWFHRRQDDDAAAIRYFERVLELANASYGEQSRQTAKALENLGRTLYFADRPDEAVAHLEQAVAAHELSPEPFAAAEARGTREKLADALRKAGDLARAEAIYRELIEEWDGSDTPGASSTVATLYNSLVLLYASQDRWKDILKALDNFGTPDDGFNAWFGLHHLAASQLHGAKANTSPHAASAFHLLAVMAERGFRPATEELAVVLESSPYLPRASDPSLLARWRTPDRAQEGEVLAPPADDAFGTCAHRAHHGEMLEIFREANRAIAARPEEAGQIAAAAEERIVTLASDAGSQRVTFSFGDIPSQVVLSLLGDLRSGPDASIMVDADAALGRLSLFAHGAPLALVEAQVLDVLGAEAACAPGWIRYRATPEARGKNTRSFVISNFILALTQSAPGRGVIQWSGDHGARWEGPIMDRSPAGEGVMTAGAWMWRAAIVDGMVQGPGTLTADSRYELVGTFVDGLPHGQGRLHDELDGLFGEGRFVHGRFTGQARALLPAAGVGAQIEYVGPFVNGEPHGEGSCSIGEARYSCRFGNGTWIGIDDIDLRELQAAISDLPG